MQRKLSGARRLMIAVSILWILTAGFLWMIGAQFYGPQFPWGLFALPLAALWFIAGLCEWVLKGFRDGQ